MDTESLAIASHDDHTPATGGGDDDPARETTAPSRSANAHAEVDHLAAVVESMLFAAGAPVPVARLVDALDGPGRAEVVRALDALAASYAREGRGLRLVQVAGGYQLRTPAEHGPWVRRLLRERPPRLSRPMLETLAVIAYRQPCTRIEIEAVRGVDADAVLATLTDRRLVRILGARMRPAGRSSTERRATSSRSSALPDLTALPPLRDLARAPMLATADLTVSASGVEETPAPPAAEESGVAGDVAESA
jgi:segregation and condensation protein B